MILVAKKMFAEKLDNNGKNGCSLCVAFSPFILVFSRLHVIAVYHNIFCGRCQGLCHFFFSIHLKDGVQNELAEGAGKLLAIRTSGSLTELPGFWVKISVHINYRITS